MKNILSKQGFIRGFLSLLIIVAIIYVGISFGKPYYRYNTLRSHTKDMLLTGIDNVEAVKEKVLAEAAELQIPLKESNVDVTMSPVSKAIKVKATWSETVDFWGYYQKKLDFVMTVEG